MWPWKTSEFVIEVAMFAPITIGLALITLMMSAASSVTTMLVVVEEDWSKAVAKIPIASPAPFR